MSWSFSDAHRWQYSISNQEGRSISVNLRLSDPTLGGRFRATEVSWSWTEYFTPPWARLHALALITQGGFGIGDKRQFFGLGGYASQDVLRGVLLNQQQFAFLRGYPVNVVAGDSYLVASGEYRAPLVWIEHGYQTFPLFLRRIWATGFVDAGDAFQGPFHPQRAEGRRGGRGTPRIRALLLPQHPDPARLRARVPVGRRQPTLLRHGGQLLIDRSSSADLRSTAVGRRTDEGAVRGQAFERSQCRNGKKRHRAGETALVSALSSGGWSCSSCSPRAVAVKAPKAPPARRRRMVGAKGSAPTG